MFTDCKGVQDGLRRPEQQLVSAFSRLGRTWSMVLGALDHELGKASSRTVWVPAHISCARMMASPPLTSQGIALSWIQWRANRLADVLAKAAAARDRLPEKIFKWIKDAQQLHQHQAAVLGLATHAATHFERRVVDPHGQTVTHLIRDSAGQRPRRPRTWRRYQPQQASQAIAPSAMAPRDMAERPPAPLGPRAKRRRLTQVYLQQRQISSARQVATHLAATSLAPSAGPPASDRLAALRERIRAREREEKEWESERRNASSWD